MKKSLHIALLTLATLSGSSAMAQGWSGECADPEATAGGTPLYSDDYGVTQLGNQLINMSFGLSGTARWDFLGCRNPAFGELPAQGRFAFSVGPVGSVQTAFDNNLAMTTGAPRDPVGDFTFAQIIKDTGPGAGGKTAVTFANGGYRTFFTGSSRRYIECSWADADTLVELEVRVIADAVRLRWRLRNISQNTLGLGLRWGMTSGMRSQGLDNLGHNQSLSLMGTLTGIPRPLNVPNPGPVPYIGFMEVPTTRPIRTSRNLMRGSVRFPSYVGMQWSQAQPYGYRLDTSATESAPDATDVEQVLIEGFDRMMDGGFAGAIASRVFNDPQAGRPGIDDVTDVGPIREDSDVAFAQAAIATLFKAQPVAPGSFRDVVFYVRSPWGLSDYLDPYSVVIDAPRIVETDRNGTNGLTPNPMTIAAYLDNQYADVDREVPLQNVRMTISFPEGSGLSLAAGETAEKTIARVDPNEIVNRSWNVVSDGQKVGYQPYTITFSSTPGPTKSLTGTVLVSATPKVRLAQGPNLVTLPWDFADTSLESILGPVGDPNGLKIGRDFLAYQWDPGQGAYLPITSATRGTAVWIVPLSDQGFRDLNGALVPSDQADGGTVTTLQPGWNMIGNPYSVPVPLSQLIGVGEDDPSTALTWRDLVNNGWVSGSLAFWQRANDDPTSGSYLFTEGDTALLQPQTGYWVFVSTLKPIRLSWPPIFAAGLTSSSRSTSTGTSTVWRQTDKQWRLNLVARNGNSLDSSNYVGVASNAQEALARRIYEPPTAPDTTVELSIREMINGKPTRLAQSLTNQLIRTTWKVTAKATEAGDVTVTWPNINSIPKNVRMVLKDASNNVTKDLRFASSYTFRMDQPGTRELELTMEPGGVSRALIGNVAVGRPSRSPNAPLTVTYTLSSDAITTVRILSGAGREVYTISRGRSVSAGARTETWNLRDSANRAVPPGTYQVEILAETTNGERVRRVVPVNITR